MPNWNPWHGCHKISEGCKNCYVYRQDAMYDKASFIVKKTSSFDLPLKKSKNGKYKLKSNEIVYTCLTSDFFVEEADLWRPETYEMIKQRNDLNFLIITKRIDRFYVNLPSDWNDGYSNLIIGCTVENQDRANYRLPIYLGLPLKHKIIICEPILEKLDLLPYLNDSIEEVVVGGESGNNARVCDYDWILDLRKQCIEYGVKFVFKQTGAFFRKDGKIYRIRRKFQHSQAQKANIDYVV